MVRQYLNSSTQSDLAATLNLYTDQIDYFDKETISKAAVYDDKHAYLERWPNRSYDLASSVATLASTDNTRQVRFDYNYRVSGSGKEASGKAYTILSLQKSDGKVLITGEKGGVYPKPVSHTAPAASPTNSTPSASGAPRFPQWYFTTCQDASSGARQTGLSVGRLQRCDLVIETVPNGAEPIEAVFNYELEYQQNGTTQKFMVDAPDHWPSSSEPVTNFRREGNNLIFTLPLTVKDRTDRRYTSINAIGDIRFSNSSSKRIYERLPIH